MTATVKASTVQVVEGVPVGANLVTNQVASVQASTEATVTAQVIQAAVPSATATAVSKQLILAPPTITNLKSSTVQVLEGQDTSPAITLVTSQIAAVPVGSENSVTAQMMTVPIAGSQAQAVTKQLILAGTLAVRASEITVEVIGDSSITPPVPGQRVVRFFN